MILYIAEASRHFGCTEIFKEPSKFAWSDYYKDHFFVPYQKIVLVTNKRVMLLRVCLMNLNSLLASHLNS
jgi:vacuolar protein sorting-associated protein 13A/C